jgi:hypothetical protein
MFGFLSGEPTLEGRTVGSWLRQYEVECISSRWAEATKVFERSGNKSVPGLIRIINARPPVAAHFILTHTWVYGHVPSGIQSWAWQKDMTAVGDRCWAIMLCAELGTNAYAAHPSLIAACRDSECNVRREAAKAVARTGVPSDIAVRLLSEMMLRDSYYDVRSWAAYSLGVLGEKAQTAIPALCQATNDPYEGTRSWARQALAKVENETNQKNRKGTHVMSELR